MGLLTQQGLAEADSLEKVVEQLMRVFGIDVLDFLAQKGIAEDELPIARSGGGFGNLVNRNIFYDALGAVKARAGTAGGYTIVALADMPIETLMAAARDGSATGVAYRYALREGNPFAVLGADYSAFNANGELTLRSTSSPSGS